MNKTKHIDKQKRTNKMKKLTILFAAVALMAMTACNEKPAENNAAPADAKAPTKTEQQTPAADNPADQPKVNVEHIKATNDGKEAAMAEFTDAKGTKVKLVNKGDGTVNVRIWVNGKDAPAFDVDSKNCVTGDKNYMLQSADGTTVILVTEPGKENVTVMKGKQIAYSTKQ